MRIKKLAIAITFFFSEDRLQYLTRITKHFPTLSDDVHTFVITNSRSEADHEKIKFAVKESCDPKIHVPSLIGHPYLLPWFHFDIFKKLYESNEKFTNFMYLEDDIEIKEENINYWLEARIALRQHNLIPSFIRYEIKDSVEAPFCTDITQPIEFLKLPKVKMSDSYFYLNLPQPYQGMYLLDRELAQEHFYGESSSPDFGKWRIRERAAQGLTFLNVPAGFFSRNLVGYHFLDKSIDLRSLIHNVPNNYANNPKTKFAKISVKELIKNS